MSIWSNWIIREVFPVVRNTDCHLPQVCHPPQCHHHSPRRARPAQVRKVQISRLVHSKLEEWLTPAVMETQLLKPLVPQWKPRLRSSNESGPRWNSLLCGSLTRFHSILSVILDSMKREMPPQWLSRENLILGRISTGWTITFLERWVASSKFL